MFLILFALPILFAQLAEASASQALALTIAGAFTNLAMWGIKKLSPPNVPGTQSSLHGTKAFALTLVVSAVVTFVALLVKRDPALMLLLSGDLSNLAGLYQAALSVLGVATAVYKFFMEKNRPKGETS